MENRKKSEREQFMDSMKKEAEVAFQHMQKGIIINFRYNTEQENEEEPNINVMPFLKNVDEPELAAAIQVLISSLVFSKGVPPEQVREICLEGVETTEKILKDLSKPETIN